jgi:hypothetical protein
METYLNKNDNEGLVIESPVSSSINDSSNGNNWDDSAILSLFDAAIKSHKITKSTTNLSNDDNKVNPRIGKIKYSYLYLYHIIYIYIIIFILNS